MSLSTYDLVNYKSKEVQKYTERLYIIQTEETIRQFVGLQYNPLIIEEIVKIKAKCISYF